MLKNGARDYTANRNYDCICNTLSRRNFRYIYKCYVIEKKEKYFLQGDKEECFCSEKISAFLEEKVTVDKDKQKRLQIHFKPSLLERKEIL